MNYQNQLCPICNKPFSEDDDVVVCPDCGTPFHRECYRQNGGCVNASLHGTGFSYVAPLPEKAKEPEAVPEKAKEPASPETINDPAEMLPEQFGELFQDIKDKTPDQINIDGKKASLYEAAVGRNQNYYLPRFIVMDRTKKNTVWNLAAFFFPFSWSFYRKMYKLAVMVLLADLILMIGSYAPYFLNQNYMNTLQACVQENPQFITDIMQYERDNGSVSLTKNETLYVEAVKAVNYPQMLSVIFPAADFCICVLTGLFGTRWYKDKLSKNIEDSENLGLSEEQLKSFLPRKYGVAPLIIALFFAFFEFLRYIS